jgi:hypothetical protein
VAFVPLHVMQRCSAIPKSAGDKKWPPPKATRVLPQTLQKIAVLIPEKELLVMTLGLT